MRILQCEDCGYQRSNEDDGRMFGEDAAGRLLCSDHREEWL